MLGSTEAESPVVQGLITGIGFIGGGAILGRESNVRGTATAASLWITGLIDSPAATTIRQASGAASVLRPKRAIPRVRANPAPISTREAPA